MADTLKIFVYGTLKVGGAFAHRFDKFRQSTKSGRIRGTMFNVFDSYPGLKLSGDTTIKGEVHEYTNAKEVEQALDRIEGYLGLNNARNLYDKRTVLVETDDGTEECIVYEFARETTQLKEVTAGEWVI